MRFNIFVKLSLLFQLLVLSLSSMSQDIKSYPLSNPNNTEIGVSWGYGSYLMSDLKNLQQYLMGESGLALRNTASFPDYFNYSVRYGTRTGADFSGVTAGFMSTGARSSLGDYSGYYLLDINCQAIYLGYYVRHALMKGMLFGNMVEAGYLVSLSGLNSTVSISNQLHLYSADENDYDQSDSYKFNSLGLYVEPLLYMRYMFSKNIGLELNAGAAGSLSIPLYYQKIDNAIKINDKYRYANWSGFRVSLGLVIGLK